MNIYSFDLYSHDIIRYRCQIRATSEEEAKKQIKNKYWDNLIDYECISDGDVINIQLIDKQNIGE